MHTDAHTNTHTYTFTQHEKYDFPTQSIDQETTSKFLLFRAVYERFQEQRGWSGTSTLWARISFLVRFIVNLVLAFRESISRFEMKMQVSAKFWQKI